MNEGKYREALELFKKDHPFPGICGRVCHHPCEEVCTRNEVEQTLAIQHLHRFLADWDMARENYYVPEKKEAKKEKVAIIGAGPAGATCARALARHGIRVLLLDKHRFPRSKPCGGGFSQKARNLFDFDLSPVIETRITLAEISLQSKNPALIHCPEGAGYMVTRDKFDTLLVNKAAEAGVDVKIILDPSKDAFGREKNGIPNQPVAYELTKKSHGKIRIRWYHTHGEQFHTKLTLIEKRCCRFIYRSRTCIRSSFRHVAVHPTGGNHGYRIFDGVFI